MTFHDESCWNGRFYVKVATLPYSFPFPTQYWSSACTGCENDEFTESAVLRLQPPSSSLLITSSSSFILITATSASLRMIRLYEAPALSVSSTFTRRTCKLTLWPSCEPHVCSRLYFVRLPYVPDVVRSPLSSHLCFYRLQQFGVELVTPAILFWHSQGFYPRNVSHFFIDIFKT